MVKILAGLMLCLTVVGCGSERKQNAADAIAGVEAVELYGADIATVAGPTKLYIASASGSLIEDLPAPSIPPHQVERRLAQYQQGAKESQEGLGFWAQIAAWGGGFAAIALGLARTLGIGGPLVGVAESILVSRQGKREKEKQRELATVAGYAIQAIEAIDHKGIKQLINDSVTDKQRAVIAAYLAQQESNDGQAKA